MSYEDMIAGPIKDIQDAIQESDLYKNELESVIVGTWDNELDYPLVAIAPNLSEETDHEIWEDNIQVYVLDKDNDKDNNLLELGKMGGQIADIIELYFRDNKNSSDVRWIKMDNYEWGEDITNEFISGFRFELDLRKKET